MYIDTSMLAKLYLPEPESARVQAAVAAGGNLVCAELLLAEFASVLSRKVRERTLTPAARARVWALFQEHVSVGAIALLPLRRPQIVKAGDILRNLGGLVPLRAMDALHLASCLDAAPGQHALLTGDGIMIKAASKLDILLQSW